MDNARTSKKNWEKVKELMEHHKDILAPDAVYIPKMFYRPAGKEELYVSFFINELQRGKDIYTEMVNRDYESEDPSRTLYKLPYNEYWKTQYEETETSPVRYLVPMSELVKTDNKPEDLTDYIEDDCTIDELSIRDLYAIIQNRPVSHKKWLSELIESNSR